MSIKVKQGDAYSIPIKVNLDGATVAIADISLVEFYIGNIRKLYPADVSYDSATGCFNIPMTQAETFSLPEGESVPMDIRVKFNGGNIMGISRQIDISVIDAMSREVL